MPRKLIAALGAVALALTLTASPASAHHYDVTGYWFCSANRSGPEQHIVHSWPYRLEPGYRVDVCTEDFFGNRRQFFTRWNVDTLVVTRVSGYQPCSVVICTPHG